MTRAAGSNLLTVKQHILFISEILSEVMGNFWEVPDSLDEILISGKSSNAVNSKNIKIL